MTSVPISTAPPGQRPAQAGVPPTPPTSRDELLQLGQSGRGWEFVGAAAKALLVSPGDDGLRFLTSANLARLGLKTLALEQLGSLPPGAEGHMDVRSLRAAAGALPCDVVPVQDRIAACERNVSALGDRCGSLASSLAAWRNDAANSQWFRALDGNVVGRALAAGLEACTHLHDLRGWASRFTASTSGLSKASVVVVEGASPPWLFEEMHRATPAQALGFRVPLLVVQADAMELLDGLSVSDQSEALADTRVRVMAGPDAAAQLADFLESRNEFQISTLVAPMAGTRTRVSPGVQAVVEKALSRQDAEFTRARARVESLYAGRDKSWWAGRYREALAGAGKGGEPLRVLIPTCRYSTFIKHASADLCATLNRQGCRAELYCEPDNTTKLTGVGYLRAFERFQPDLVVLINFPRDSMGEAMPRNVPFVCWVQDCMPHLFDEKVGAAQGELDFLIGHTFLELFQKYGYPMERTMPISVVANEAKFFRGAMGSGQWAMRNQQQAGHPVAQCQLPIPHLPRFACDIAFVSHHSETPRAMHERLVRETAHAPAIAKVFELLYPDIEQAVAHAATAPANATIQDAAAIRLREVLGREPDQRTGTLVVRQYAAPMLDRMLRHETLGWAAELAEERGWKLNIYGKGWDKTQRFAPYARGELAHGEELRVSYKGAGVHLHVAASTLTHQRVIECSLSGGLCISRLHRDAVASARLNAQLALLERAPDVVDETGMLGYRIADHPEAMMLARTMTLGGDAPVSEFIWISQARALSHRRFAPVLARDTDPTFLLGDLSETTFLDKPGLAMLIEKARANPPWRAAVSDMIAGRARKSLTHDALARRMLNLVHTSLARGVMKEAV